MLVVCNIYRLWKYRCFDVLADIIEYVAKKKKKKKK